mgnify:CR=1 FL=1
MPFDTSTMCGYDADPTDPTSSYGILLALEPKDLTVIVTEVKERIIKLASDLT